MGCDLCVSVADKCNFSCIYCSQLTMENYTPQEYKSLDVPSSDLIEIVKKVASLVHPYTISITGGEPLLNPQLPVIAKELKPFAQRMELTTNGSLYDSKKWEALQNVFSRVKVSVDTMNSLNFKKITGTKNIEYLHFIINMIKHLKEKHENVAINCVILKDYISDLLSLADFSLKEEIKLQLFEFTYNEHRKEIWKKQFMPLTSIIPLFEQKYGIINKEITSHGDYYKIMLKNSYIRFRASSNKTMRSSCCVNCPHYCFEGLLFLRISRQGWISVCPFANRYLGALITKNMSLDEIWHKIYPMVNALQTAKICFNSLDTFLKKRQI